MSSHYIIRFFIYLKFSDQKKSLSLSGIEWGSFAGYSDSGKLLPALLRNLKADKDYLTSAIQPPYRPRPRA